MDIIAVLLIIATWYLRAFSDAIDHAKGGRSLYELWHISELVIHGSLYIYIAILVQMPIIWIVIALIGMWYWDTAYAYFRSIKVNQWDENWKCKMVRKLLKFTRPEDTQ